MINRPTVHGIPDTPSRWVAKLWRSVCGPTRLLISAAWAASTTIRCSCRVLIGFIAC
jgi:hypothetical protein